MSKQVDFEVLQMVCSRLCHDLVGTVGAVNAAVEIIEDEGGNTVDPDVIKLLSTSAGEAARKLSFYRAAFGLGGSNSTLIDFEQIKKLVEDLLNGGKVNFKWVGDTTTALPNIAAKLIYMMSLISYDALPRGGMISMHIQSFPEGLGLACAAEGAGAAIREEIVSTLEGNVSVNDLSSREVHAYYTKILTDIAETKIEIGAGESLINLAILLPSRTLQ